MKRSFIKKSIDEVVEKMDIKPESFDSLNSTKNIAYPMHRMKSRGVKIFLITLCCLYCSFMSLEKEMKSKIHFGKSWPVKICFLPLNFLPSVFTLFHFLLHLKVIINVAILFVI